MTEKHPLKSIALIPARYASTRFPAKLVQDLYGLSVIQRTYLSTKETGVFDQVVVVTDHKSIADQIKVLGGDVFFSSKEYESGSDRIAEAALQLEADIFVNVQGDEPFQDKDSLEHLNAAFSDPKVQVASMMFAISAEEAQNPNAVKVVVDKDDFALYFSRSPIPYIREKGVEILYWKHVGVYGYRKDVLLSFTQWPKSFLEQTEMLEQLRMLENGIRIKMVPTEHQAIAIDTKEDLEKALRWMKDEG